MNLLTNDNPLLLWRDTVQVAERKCAVTLKHELESYLVTLLNQYTDKPEISKTVLGSALLAANQSSTSIRNNSLQQVGDQCLLYAGLFPHAAKRKLVKINYFVQIGRSAYTLISHRSNDLFGALAFEFVVLMDVLQCIKPLNDLMPLDAYEQWQDVGSKHALQVLNEYRQKPTQ